MTHTDMTKPFSSNPKLADWVPLEQQIQTITAARELWDLVPEEEGDDLNLFKINALDVRSHLHPEVTGSVFGSNASCLSLMSLQSQSHG